MPIVIRGPLGAPLNGKNFGRRDWSTACLSAGIDPPRLHDLRHTYGSWMVQAGVNLQVLQNLMGHRSAKTTEIYAHLKLEQLALAQGKIKIGEE